MLILEILAGIILTGIIVVVLFALLVMVLRNDYPREPRKKYGPVGTEIIEAREAWERVARASSNDYHADCQTRRSSPKGGNLTP